MQFIAGKRSRDDKSDVFFVCTFCEEDRQNVAVAQTRLTSFLAWLKNVLEERFPSITLSQDEPVIFFSAKILVLC